MKILTVIPLKKGILKENLTYFTSLDISPGDIVTVPLRSKHTLGLVLSTEDLNDNRSAVKDMDFSLKKITESKGASVFLPEFFDSVIETAKYFIQSPSMVAGSVIPRVFIEEYDTIAKLKTNGVNTNDRMIRAEKLLFQVPFEERLSSYKTLIRESFARGKSIFLILPTELDIEHFAKNLSKGIEQFTHALHGGKPAKKNSETYEKIISDEHPLLIIATPPFLSVPRTDIGTIILEHESSQAYKTVQRPYLDLRVFVEIYASKIGARFIMADSLLRFETIARKELEGLNFLYPPSYRIGHGEVIDVLSKKKATPEERFKVLLSESMENIESAIDNKKNVFVFSLRKGLATQTVCKDCGNAVSCDQCGSVYTLYLSQNGKKRMFVCNKCGNSKESETRCDMCNSWNLIPLGIGTDTVAEFLKEALPNAKIYKLDKESAKTAAGAKKIIKDFEAEKGAVLVGTEMALLYMNEEVALSVIASFDSLWSIPNFRMSEKILRIMLLLLDKTKHKFIIQAKNDSDSAIIAVERGNITEFVREELADREALGYPPYKRFIKISFSGEKADAAKVRDFLKKMFEEYEPEIFSGYVPKIKEQYSTNMLIKLETKEWNVPCIALGSTINEALHKKLLSLPPDFKIYIDPEDLL